MTHDKDFLSPIEDVIADARNGRMIILVDDEGRENEGDLVIPAQLATPEAINFMAKHGRGLICLALTGGRVEQLGLPPMSARNETAQQTAFTVAIEAKEGVSTGISAADRSHTIAVAIDPTKGRDDIGSPGHVFPLIARDGGVLVRAGHTEAAVDIARLAGLNPSGVVCEIMNDDGTMARLPDLVKFAQFHGLKVATIADLIAYRLRYDTVVERTAESPLKSRHGGDFRMVLYADTVVGAEHVALVKGHLSTPPPVLVRVHVLRVLDDVFGDETSGRGGELQAAMRLIAEAGRGVVVLIRSPVPASLADEVRKRHGDTPAGEDEAVNRGLREIGIGAQILLDLGVRDMIVLSNTQQHLIGIEGFGLTVVEQRPIPLDEG